MVKQTPCMAKSIHLCIVVRKNYSSRLKFRRIIVIGNAVQLLILKARICPYCFTNYYPSISIINIKQETQLSPTNRATRLDVSHGHQTWYHS